VFPIMQRPGCLRCPDAHPRMKKRRVRPFNPSTFRPAKFPNFHQYPRAASTLGCNDKVRHSRVGRSILNRDPDGVKVTTERSSFSWVLLTIDHSLHRLPDLSSWEGGIVTPMISSQASHHQLHRPAPRILFSRTARLKTL
jgi:hypothetical protein